MIDSFSNWFFGKSIFAAFRFLFKPISIGNIIKSVLNGISKMNSDFNVFVAGFFSHLVVDSLFTSVATALFVVKLFFFHARISMSSWIFVWENSFQKIWQMQLEWMINYLRESQLPSYTRFKVSVFFLFIFFFFCFFCCLFDWWWRRWRISSVRSFINQYFQFGYALQIKIKSRFLLLFITFDAWIFCSMFYFNLIFLLEPIENQTSHNEIKKRETKKKPMEKNKL